MVQAMYNAVKQTNPKVLFGISPQGTLSGNEKQSADVQTWGQTAGYCDYLLPQLYFGFQNSTAPFAETAAFWAEQVTCPDVSLWIGICTYKIGQLLCNMDGIDGAAIYDYASTFQPESSVSEILSSERDAIQVLLQTPAN